MTAVSLLVLLLAICLAHAQQQPPFPANLPSQFASEIEANILNRGYTLQVTEYYDFPNDRSRIDTIRNGTRHVVIHDFSNQIVYNANLDRQTCRASRTTDAGFNPFRVINGNGEAHLIGISDFFNLGKRYHDRYIGTAMVRGILCDQYMGFYTNTSDGVFVNYTMQWYFAKRENWTMPMGSVMPDTAIPVRLDLVGITNRTGGPPPGVPRPPGFNVTNTGPRTFHHVYDFVNFRIGPLAQLTGELFNPPPLIYCSGVPVTKDLPPIPDQFSLESVFTTSSTNSTLTTLVSMVLFT